MEKRQAIIFDFGNVLGPFYYTRATNAVAQLTRGKWSPEEIKKLVFREPNIMRELESGAITSETFLKYLQETFGLEHISHQELALAWSDIFEENKAVTSLILRLPPTVRLVLGSNTNELHFNHFRQQFKKPLDRFHAFILSYEIKCLKPAERFFRACINAAGCPPENCLYFDDIPEYIIVACKLGIDGEVYTPDLDVEAELNKRGVLLTSA
jgi:putative hydrolase of the HAD superfamily